ncbi:MAG: phage holin, LLH family [Bacillota bacterium]|nr:MAG: hypothetical protein DIU70_06665 [Bacillota bacterium]
MTANLTDLLTQILTLVAVVIVQVAGAALIRWLRARYTAQQIETGMEVARIVVRAVEQIAATTGADMRGRAKLQEAIARARAIAAQRGLDLSDEQWRTILEAAVLELKALGEELKRPADEPAA